MMISTYQRTAVEAWADRGTAMVVALKRTRLLAAVVDTIPCPPASRTEELFQSPGVLTVANDTAREQGRPLRRYRDPVPLVHRTASDWTGCVGSLYGHSSGCWLQHEIG